MLYDYIIPIELFVEGEETYWLSCQTNFVIIPSCTV